MLREASRSPASTPSKPISLARADHGRARGLIVRASKHRRLFATRRIADQCRGNGRERSDDAPLQDEARKLLVVLLQLVAAGAGSDRGNDDAGMTLQPSRHVVKRGWRRRDEDNIGRKKLFVAGHPPAQLTAEGGCRSAAGMRSADRNRVRRSFGESCRKGSAHAPRADNDNPFTLLLLLGRRRNGL